MTGALELFGTPPLTPQEAQMISPLRLAYIGDSVHDLMVRHGLLTDGGNVRSMHREAVSAVNAGAQARALERILPELTEAEADVVRRGRNAHAHHTVPKRADPRDYALATGLEALFGFLFLTGQLTRLRGLYDAMQIADA